MWSAFFSAAVEYGWDLVCPLDASCGDNTGPMEQSTFDELADELLSALKKELPVDGVLLPLHGSLLAEHLADTEGYLLEQIRRLVGDDTPISVALDLHANVTRKMCENANIVTAFRTNPHVDQYETGQRAAKLLHRTLNGEIKPRTVLARLPMLDALDRGRTLDPESPMCGLLAEAAKVEAEGTGILLVSIHAGYAWADFAEAGPSVAVVYDDMQERGEEEAYRLATRFIGKVWRSKDVRSVQLFSLKDAMSLARAVEPGSKPLVISEYTDSPGGGGYGDCTNLLQAMLATNLDNAVFFAIADPVAVEACHAAGINATVTLELGGKMDRRFSGSPLGLTGLVNALSDGRYIRKGPVSRGTVGQMGPSARLTVGGVDIIITARPTMADDREQLRTLNVSPEKSQVIALKGIIHFRADYEPISSGVIAVDAKGICTLDYRTFPYRHLTRPIWPLDDMSFLNSVDE